jgi:hypothetical protein
MLEDNTEHTHVPFFSICIPQYNRTEFLILACKRLEIQTFTDFEICISDDCSTDGQSDYLLKHLRGSGLSYAYIRTERNLRYDGNLRSAISLSKGKYLLLMGNDDGLADENVLSSIHFYLEKFAPVSVALTNYRECGGIGREFKRVSRTGILGSGADTAASVFRNYSFVSGVLLDGPRSRSLATSIVDGSEMYQMYLATRLVAEGGQLLGIDELCIDKDLQIPGHTVDSYRSKPVISPCPIVKRPLPMGRLLEVVARGLEVENSQKRRAELVARVANQLYAFTYPFWGIEFRRVQSWRYAVGVFLALTPKDIASGVNLSVGQVAKLWLSYFVSSAAALATPLWLFDAIRPQLYWFAKQWQAH